MSEILSTLLALFDAYDSASFTDGGDHSEITNEDERPLIAAYEAAVPVVDRYRSGESRGVACTICDRAIQKAEELARSGYRIDQSQLAVVQAQIAVATHQAGGHGR